MGRILVRSASLKSRPAFTLIELLVVIAIIAILAAFAIPVLKSVARKKVLDRTRAEMIQLETAIGSYHDAYGFYPPSNPNYHPNDLAVASQSQSMMSPLYFELLGTTNIGGVYYTLDALEGGPFISTADVLLAYGVSGFINCSKIGGGEDAPAARNFLPDLRSDQFMTASNHNRLATVLVASVGGPDANYKPFYDTPNFNPWRYLNPGVNNRNSYDLWVQLVIGGKTNLVCNWSKQVQLNSPLP